jgi:hypothetical protein
MMFVQQSVRRAPTAPRQRRRAGSAVAPQILRRVPFRVRPIASSLPFWRAPAFVLCSNAAPVALPTCAARLEVFR